jgi:hypothetical protein
MPFPFILLGVGALLGGGAAVHGVSQMSEATGIASRAEGRLEDARVRFDGQAQRVEHAVSAYLCEADRVVIDSVLPLVEWLRRQNRTVELQDVLRDPRLPSEGLADAVWPDGPHGVDVGSLLLKLAGAGATAMAAPGALMWLAATFGVASTGTPIAALLGASQASAAAAWLGGGALAAGGGGVAAGSALLSASVPVVGLLVGGIALSVTGMQARTEAEGFSAQVDVAVASTDALGDRLGHLVDWVALLTELVLHLEQRLVEQTQLLLDHDEFDPATDAERLTLALALAATIMTVLRAPLVDPDEFTIDPETAGLVARLSEES